MSRTSISRLMVGFIAAGATMQVWAIPLVIDPDRSTARLDAVISTSGITGSWDADAIAGLIAAGSGRYFVTTTTETLQNRLFRIDSRESSVSGEIDVDLQGDNLVFNGASIEPRNLLTGNVPALDASVDVNGGGLSGLILELIGGFVEPAFESLIPASDVEVSLSDAELDISGETALSGDSFAVDSLTGEWDAVLQTSLGFVDLGVTPFQLVGGSGTFVRGASMDELFLPFVYTIETTIAASTFYGGTSNYCLADGVLFCLGDLNIAPPRGTLNILTTITGNLFATGLIAEAPPAVDVPEPGTLGLLCLGLFGLGLARRKQTAE